MRFACRPGADDAVAAGETCDPHGDVCVEGYACVEDGGAYVCLATCGGEAAGAGEGACAEGESCSDEPLRVCRSHG